MSNTPRPTSGNGGTKNDVHHDSKHGHKHKHKGGGGRYGAMGGYGGVKRSEAAGLVNGQIKQLMNEFRHQMEQIRSDHQQAVGDLRYLHNEVKGYVGTQNNKINQGYNQTKRAVAGQDAALQTQMADTSGGIKAAAQAEMDRLGVQQAGMGTFDADQANAQNTALQMGANNQANLGLMQSAGNEVGALLQGMNDGQFLSNMGNERNAMTEAKNDIRSQQRDTLAGRGDAINQLLMQMNDSRFQQWLGLQNLRLDRRSLNSSIAMQRAGMLHDAAYAQAAANAYGQVYGGNGLSGSPGTSNAQGKTHKHRYHPVPQNGNQSDQYTGGLAGGWS